MNDNDNDNVSKISHFDSLDMIEKTQPEIFNAFGSFPFYFEVFVVLAVDVFL